ncbi:hypothetical protein GT360_17810 [Vibrio astriarenae]|uniref:Uncharacterized protein n=1 Tax=Vibrio astriarenae TaxID=1481923 RepID=A0A7Z2T719_9VIBR|nr:hypothetical protein [Vibrio astriarenae]QIA65396.1 hypothetical protein GT360_17810 [Vibrio astriarenae]
MYYKNNLQIIDVNRVIPAKDYILSTAIKKLDDNAITEQGVSGCVSLSHCYEDYAERVVEIVNSLPAMLFVVEDEEGGAIIFNGIDALDSLRVNGLTSTQECPIENNQVLEIFIDEVCSWHTTRCA